MVHPPAEVRVEGTEAQSPGTHALIQETWPLYVRPMEPYLVQELQMADVARSISSTFDPSRDVDIPADSLKPFSEIQKLQAVETLFDDRADFTSARSEFLKQYYGEIYPFQQKLLHTLVPLREAKTTREMVTAVSHAMIGECSSRNNGFREALRAGGGLIVI